MRSNYVCAGFETFASILDRFIKSENFQDNFTRQDISNFLNNTCNKFLHSFGQNFKDRRRLEKYNKKESEVFIKCRDFGFFDNSEFICDSGGFQVSVGLLNRQKTEALFQLYYEFLNDYIDVYDKAFILDIPPGPGCEIFKDFSDVYKWNNDSYIKAAMLPQNVKDKIIYVHHFRTPELWRIYTKIMNDNDMFGHFQHHATGGIVANMASDSIIPCIIYIIPLIPLLNQAIKHNRNYLNFHILGGANYRDIMFYELFKIHVKKIHNIELNITYDSSQLFKGLMVGRTIFAFEDNIIRKMNIRTEYLDKRLTNDGKTTIQVYQKMISEMSSKYNFKQININDSIYCDKSGTFFEDVRSYSLMYMLYMYSEVQTYLHQQAHEIYPLFESNNLVEFNSKCQQVTQNINNGKITKKQKSKASSIIKSLEMLTELDEDYCKHIVDKFLSKDEFIELIDERKILTF